MTALARSRSHSPESLSASTRMIALARARSHSPASFSASNQQIVAQDKASSLLVAKVAHKRRKRKTSLSHKKYASIKNRKNFAAFEVEQVTPEGASKIAVVSPETGIHSQQWAAKIELQPGTIVSLPFEIRRKILTHVLCPNGTEPIIKPVKAGAGFRGIDFKTYNSPLLKAYSIMSLVARQFYVDIVGGSMLYRITQFHFSSGTTMLNYLTCINPAHKESITDIKLSLTVSRLTPHLPRNAILALASLPSLRYLTLILNSTNWNDYPISISQTLAPTTILGRIMDNRNLREIKGLKEFHLDFYNRKYSSAMMFPKLGYDGMSNTFGIVEDVLKAELTKGGGNGYSSR